MNLTNHPDVVYGIRVHVYSSCGIGLSTRRSLPMVKTDQPTKERTKDQVFWSVFAIRMRRHKFIFSTDSYEQ